MSTAPFEGPSSGPDPGFEAEGGQGVEGEDFVPPRVPEGTSTAEVVDDEDPNRGSDDDDDDSDDDDDVDSSDGSSEESDVTEESEDDFENTSEDSDSSTISGISNLSSISSLSGFSELWRRYGPGRVGREVEEMEVEVEEEVAEPENENEWIYQIVAENGHIDYEHLMYLSQRRALPFARISVPPTPEGSYVEDEEYERDQHLPFYVDAFRRNVEVDISDGDENEGDDEMDFDEEEEDEQEQKEEHEEQDDDVHVKQEDEEVEEEQEEEQEEKVDDESEEEAVEDEDEAGGDEEEALEEAEFDEEQEELVEEEKEFEMEGEEEIEDEELEMEVEEEEEEEVVMEDEEEEEGEEVIEEEKDRIEVKIEDVSEQPEEAEYEEMAEEDAGSSSTGFEELHEERPFDSATSSSDDENVGQPQHRIRTFLPFFRRHFLGRNGEQMNIINSVQEDIGNRILHMTTASGSELRIAPNEESASTSDQGADADAETLEGEEEVHPLVSYCFRQAMRARGIPLDRKRKVVEPEIVVKSEPMDDYEDDGPCSSRQNPRSSHQKPSTSRPFFNNYVNGRRDTASSSKPSAAKEIANKRRATVVDAVKKFCGQISHHLNTLEATSSVQFFEANLMTDECDLEITLASGLPLFEDPVPEPVQVAAPAPPPPEKPKRRSGRLAANAAGSSRQEPRKPVRADSEDDDDDVAGPSVKSPSPVVPPLKPEVKVNGVLESRKDEAGPAKFTKPATPAVRNSPAPVGRQTPNGSTPNTSASPMTVTVMTRSARDRSDLNQQPSTSSSTPAVPTRSLKRDVREKEKEKEKKHEEDAEDSNGEEPPVKRQRRSVNQTPVVEKAKPKKEVSVKKRQSARVAKNVKAKAEDEPTYCFCNRISFGEMVGCDNEKCEFEWFHFECIGLTSKPKGKWFCPDCRHPDNPKLPKPLVAGNGLSNGGRSHKNDDKDSDS